MTRRFVTHDTFSIERTYPAPPSVVFAAFASEEAENAWGDTGDIEKPADAAPPEFDFRVGGRERFTVTAEGAKAGDGTALTWTEQGAYLDGIDGADVPALRKEGTVEMLEGLAKYFASQRTHERP